MGELEDRVIGVLLGLAAGDRNGGPIRMAVRVAESLREQAGFDSSDIGMRYLAWWREGAMDTGPTVANVLALVASGNTFAQASQRVDRQSGGRTAGCNPAHRIAPLAMCASLDEPALGLAAAVEARLTHRHPLAGEIAAVVASLCRALIRGVPWSVSLGIAAEGRSPEARRALEDRETGELSRSGFAPEVLRSAVHFLDISDSLPDALAQSIHFAGPANYCPVLVGSIGGARWGRTQIEDASLGHHDDLLPRVTAAAQALARGWRHASSGSRNI